jgi:hypothetical protein
VSLPADRCGLCSACLHVLATQKIMLAAANPPFSHVRPGEVEMWNNALKDNPCNGDPSTGDVIRSREEAVKKSPRWKRLHSIPHYEEKQ